MSRAALNILPASATKWTILSGPMKGTVRLMNVAAFTVGRSPDCELVIVQDPKCSRQHAQISSSGHGSQVQSLNDRNLVLVNGQAIERADLNDGDVLTFGETEVQFNLTSATAAMQMPMMQVAPAARIPGRTERSRSRSKRNKPAGSNRLMIYGTLAVVIIWMLLPSKAQKMEQQLKNAQSVIDASVEEAQKLKEAADAASLKRLDNSIPNRQAQEHFVRGFRDYRKGQFERSLMAFQSCLALNPDHVLCNRYHRLAKRKFDELVQYEVVLGRKYRAQGQYKACRAAFRNVRVMVKDPNSPIFKEAQENYEACDAQVEGRF